MPLQERHTCGMTCRSTVDSGHGVRQANGPAHSSRAELCGNTQPACTSNSSSAMPVSSARGLWRTGQVCGLTALCHFKPPAPTQQTRATGGYHCSLLAYSTAWLQVPTCLQVPTSGLAFPGKRGGRSLIRKHRVDTPAAAQLHAQQREPSKCCQRCRAAGQPWHSQQGCPQGTTGSTHPSARWHENIHSEMTTPSASNVGC
jgi:hypothetical protein